MQSEEAKLVFTKSEEMMTLLARYVLCHCNVFFTFVCASNTCVDLA